MKGTYKGALRLPLFIGAHALWWVGLAMSLVVSFFSHWFGVFAYSDPCVGEGCTSYFNMDAAQFEGMARYGISSDLYAAFTVILLAIQNLSSWAVGFLLYRYGWRDLYCVTASLLLIVTGTIFSSDDALFANYPALTQMFFVLNSFGSMYIFFLFLFPEGRFVPRWTAIPAVIWLILMITSYVWPLPYFNLQDYPAVKGIYMFLMHGLVMGVQIWRYRYAKEDQKRHIRWFIWGMGCYFIAGLTTGFPIFVSNGILRMLTQIFLYTGLLFIPFSIGMMALDRLQKRSVVFNRTLVYIVLSTMSIMAYALLVGVLGTLMQGKMNAIITLMATGLIAVLFHPLRERVQRAVNHLVYGERDDPYRMLSGLTERLEGALTHRSLLPAIVETTANALRIPYAAIESVDKTGEVRRLAEYGVRDGETVSEVPLAVQGETVGRLVLGIHRVSEALPPNKRRMLDDLIRQVSIAVQAVRLTDELRRSRERLVSAREEERRRLRRDLHDGLGSGLASMMLRLDEVMTMCEREPERTKQTLLTVQSQMREAVADIRRLVYALRPPALDEFGLAFAVKELAHQMEEGSMRVVHEGFDRRLKLNAAAEVAIYRIVQEALTNAVKHSGASLCKVSLLPGEGGLHLEVADNGRGLPGAKRNGIGIGSMHERAEELGGSCSLSSVPGKGVRVNVFIPIDQEDINDVSKPIREGIDSHLAR